MLLNEHTYYNNYVYTNILYSTIKYIKKLQVKDY